jgi:hypothetical protein
VILTVNQFENDKVAYKSIEGACKILKAIAVTGHECQ